MRMRIGWGALVLVACSSGKDPSEPPTVQLEVKAVGPGSFNLVVVDDVIYVNDEGLDSFNEPIPQPASVSITAVPLSGEGGDFAGWSGTHPACTGTAPEISLGRDHTEDIACTATFNERPADPAASYAVEFLVFPGGSVELTDAAGSTVRCDAESSPCALVVEGEDLFVHAEPDNPAYAVSYEPACADLNDGICTYDLAALDPLGTGSVQIEVRFFDPEAGARNVLEACTGLSYTYDGPFGGAMFQVSPDETCSVVANDGAVLGTFAISGGNGFGGDDLLYLAAITEPSAWLSAGELTDVLVNGDPIGDGRLSVPIGVASSQVLTLFFASGLLAEVQIDGTPGSAYTTVTQTILEISLPAEP